MGLGIAELVFILILIGVVVLGADRAKKIGAGLGLLVRSLRDVNEDTKKLVAESRELIDSRYGTRLLVFLSSVMRQSVEDLQPDRDAVKDAVTNVFLLHLWRFEESPASDDIKKLYLTAARRCDIFVVLVGRAVTAPVLEEFEAAHEAGRPILAFVKKVPDRSKTAEKLISRFKKIGLRYKPYASLEELKSEILAAACLLIVQKYRDVVDVVTVAFCFFAIRSLAKAMTVDGVVAEFRDNMQSIVEEHLESEGLSVSRAC